MRKKPNYCCVRCGYDTCQKNMMRRHLYFNKKICPALQNDIDLTDTIRDYILINRIYNPPKPVPIPTPPTPQQTINQTINNYHQINNVVSNMDPIDKINKYTDYKNLEIIDLEDRIEDQYHRQVKKLDNGTFSDFRLNFQNIIEVIDSVTCIKDIDTLNVLYDEVLNKLKLFCCGEWRHVLMEAGIKEIIEKIQVCYLDHYECFLIRRYNNESTGWQYKVQVKEHIEDYYKFLAIFGITPFIYEKSNNEITGSDKDDNMHSIEEEWYPRYVAIKDRMSTSEINRVKKEVYNIVKRNAKASVLDLNKKMMDIIQMDEEFKKSIIDSISCITT